MTTTTTTNKNIDLAFEVIRQYLAEPSVRPEVDGLAAEGILVLFDETDDALSAANDEIANAYEARGEPVVRVAVQRHLTLAHR
jgi:hypothetical protein